jgi:uncharacterized protein DUF1942
LFVWHYFASGRTSPPYGISGATLSQGNESTGKIYFDVTGAPPTRVMYNNGAEDLIIWEK